MFSTSRTITGRRRLGLSLGVVALAAGSFVAWGPADPSRAYISGGATRTWVSGVGDDANPCSRTAPCKTFAGAISKTSAGGQISVLDPGGFGGVTITKAITIDGTAALGSVLVAGTNGITVNAGPTDEVILRGVNIFGGAMCGNGASTSEGLSGIQYIAGRTLIVQDSTIEGFSIAGISAQASSTDLNVHVNNSTVQANCGAGIRQSSSGAGLVHTMVDGSNLTRNGLGVRVDSGDAVVSDSDLQQNTAYGLYAATSTATLTRSTVSRSSTGIYAGNGASVALSGNTLTRNGTALGTTGSGSITSFGDNALTANTVNGSVNQTVAKV